MSSIKQFCTFFIFVFMAYALYSEGVIAAPARRKVQLTEEQKKSVSDANAEFAKSLEQSHTAYFGSPGSSARPHNQAVHNQPSTTVASRDRAEDAREERGQLAPVYIQHGGTVQRYTGHLQHH